MTTELTVDEWVAEAAGDRCQAQPLPLCGERNPRNRKQRCVRAPHDSDTWCVAGTGGAS